MWLSDPRAVSMATDQTEEDYEKSLKEKLPSRVFLRGSAHPPDLSHDAEKK